MSYQVEMMLKTMCLVILPGLAATSRMQVPSAVKSTQGQKMLKASGCSTSDCEEQVMIVDHVDAVKKEADEIEKVSDDEVKHAKKLNTDVLNLKESKKEKEAAVIDSEAAKEEEKATKHEVEQEQEEENDEKLKAFNAKTSFQKKVLKEEAKEEKVEKEIKEDKLKQEENDVEAKEAKEDVEDAEAKVAEVKVESEEKVLHIEKNMSTPEATTKVETDVKQVEAEVLTLPPAIKAQEQANVDDAKKDISKVETQKKEAEKIETDANNKLSEVKSEAEAEASVTDVIKKFGDIKTLKKSLKDCQPPVVTAAVAHSPVAVGQPVAQSAATFKGERLRGSTFAA